MLLAEPDGGGGGRGREGREERGETLAFQNYISVPCGIIHVSNNYETRYRTFPAKFRFELLDTSAEQSAYMYIV